MSLFFYKLLQGSSQRQLALNASLAWLLLITAFGPGTARAALDRVGDFALLDSAGEFHQLSRYRHRQAMAIMAYDRDCPGMADSLAAYQSLAGQHPGVAFLLIDPLDLGRETLTQYALPLPVLEDAGQLVSASLDITAAGEVLVLNPERLSLYYQGPPTELLEQALAGIEADTLADTVREAPQDCAISYPVRAAHQNQPPDYATEVAPIIIANCSECHSRGGVGPFALDSYIMLLGWSPMIREVLLNRRMPPTQVDPYLGHSDSARYLRQEDLQTLVHWIDAGAPQGDAGADPLADWSASEPGWQLGEPDYVVTAPRNEVPPTGVMDYVYRNVDLPFSGDTWLRAIQYRAGDASVLHHLMTFVVAPDEDFWGPERNQDSVTRRFVEAYAPGKSNLRVFPEGTGVLIPAGHRLAMQFHYVTNGQATADETRLGLYFSASDQLQEQLVQAVSTRFVLPPQEPDFQLQASHVFDRDVVITGVRARMNYRGKKMKFAVEQADGSLKELLSVPAYNYGWQPHYILEQAETVPAGRRLHVIGALDNSLSNPTNPDPDREIAFGLNSWDEMFTGYFTFFYPEP